MTYIGEINKVGIYPVREVTMPPSSSQVGDAVEVLIKEKDSQGELLSERVWEDDTRHGKAYSLINDVSFVSEFDLYNRMRQHSEVVGAYHHRDELTYSVFLCLVFDTEDVARGDYKWVPRTRLDEFVSKPTFIDTIDRKMRKTIPDTIAPSEGKPELITYVGSRSTSEETEERIQNADEISSQHRTLDQFEGETNE